MKKRSFWIMVLVLIGLAALILALLMQVRTADAPVTDTPVTNAPVTVDPARQVPAANESASTLGIDETDRDTVPDEATWRPADLFPATREYRGPDFELVDQRGQPIRLSDYDGRIIVLNLWATWCPPCRDEVPALIRLQEEYGEAGVQVIGVSLDENGARKAVADFAESFGINYPVPVDDGTAQQEYGPLSVIPTTYFLDRNRHIRFYAPGYLDYEQMEKAVRDLMSD